MSDLIDRDRLVDEIFSKVIKPDDDNYEYAIRLAIATLESLKSAPIVETKPKWIPVTERMPNDGEEILITSIEGTVGCAEFENGKFTAGFGAEYCNDDILAWMPLPAPYEVSE